MIERSTIRPSLNFEIALRLAAVGHRDQTRKGTDTPYVEHPMAVALMLDRAGFDEEVVIAGLLHDLVEDTDVTLARIRAGFGDRVASIVAACSEEKVDASGKKRPWIDRKRDHLAVMALADVDTQAVILADKLHNLISIRLDLLDGREVWKVFNASREQVLWYYGAMLDAADARNPNLARLLDECRLLLAEVSGLPH